MRWPRPAQFIIALLALFHVIPERAKAETGMVVFKIPFDTKLSYVFPCTTCVVVSNIANNINIDTLSIIWIGIYLTNKPKMEILQNDKFSCAVWWNSLDCLSFVIKHR